MSIAADQSEFAGHIEAIAERLSATNSALSERLVVRPGIEVRASGDLVVAADWRLPAATLSSDTRTHSADASLSLRAAGHLRIERDIGSGFDADGRAASDRAGSIRLTAGADLNAVDVLATVSGAAADVSVGRAAAGAFDPPPRAAVRSTTGDIRIAAARDIRWASANAVVYTSGVPVERGLDLSAFGSEFPDPSLSPLLAGGGSLRLRAGRDVAGTAPQAESPYVSNWWWRAKTPGTEVWWSRYDLFDQGLATLGGGDIQVDAGRDLLNLHAAAASSGFVSTPFDTTLPAVAQRFGGGSIAAAAGRDVVNGLLYAGGSRLDVSAAGAVRRDATLTNATLDPGLQLLHETTVLRVQAAGDVAVASVRNAGFTQRDERNVSADGDSVVLGLDRGSSLLLQSTSGAVAYGASPQPLVSGQSAGEGISVLGAVLPASVSLAAPGGSLTLAQTSIVQPDASSNVQLLSRDTVQVGSLRVSATHPAPGLGIGNAGTLASSLDPDLAAFFNDAGGADRSARSPVRIVSQTGDVTLSGLLAAARPVRVLAAEDIAIGNLGRLQVQHQPSQLDAAGNVVAPLSELSLLQAGRDVVGTRIAGSASGIRVGGPGELVVLAGRNVDLGTSQGIVATGNNDNSTVLPTGGANITVIAGLRADDSDYRRAAREGFAVLGGTGLMSRAGDLYALLSGADGTDSLGSPAARAFDAKPIAEKLAAVRTLLGDVADDAARVAFVRGQPKQAALSDSEALTAFGALNDSDAGLAVASALARRFGTLPSSLRQDFVSRVAATETTATAQAQQAAFVAYVAAASGQAPGGTSPTAPVSQSRLRDSLANFEQLPLERQAPWLNRRLVSDVRSFGREAAATAGTERTEAYARAYLTIDALFPASAARDGDILLPTSQIRTAQQADINLLAFGGGVNAGELIGSSNRRAADLGIVTVGGGDISALVRDNVEVNQSRVFSLRRGDILLWASEGNIDAGRGAKTVTGAPAPVLKLDAQGRLTLDASGSFTGSGIAVLDAASFLDLYAPQGEINAGDAGIKSVGGAFIAAQTFRGADNLSIGGAAVGAPPPPPSTGATAGLASVANAVGAATAATSEDPEDAKRRARRARRAVLLDFLGFGS